MSSALAGDKDGSDYAANYVKVQGGELPVRWSAIEVLHNAKYSKASDVWAFGVLVFEVMSRGQQPYAEFATLAEVAERIKGGYTMGCPDGCRPEVHTRVMSPCWQTSPRLRPRFAVLADTLIDLGATPSSTSVDRDEHAAARDFAEEKQSEAEWAASLRSHDRTLLGPSVHHIHTVLGPAVVAAVRPPWKDKKGRAVDPPESATITHAVQTVAKPAGERTVCPRDGKPGCCYVDTLTTQDDVGRAVALLSCEPPPPSTPTPTHTVAAKGAV